jgi:hypothetical protein
MGTEDVVEIRTADARWMWRRRVEEGAAAHIAECPDSDAYTLGLVLD